MENQPIENLKNKVVFIILAVISFFLLVINFIPLFVVNEGLTAVFTEDLHRDREAYVNQSNPDNHFYDSLWGNAVVGNSCETFVHFNLEVLPKETEELYFFIRYYDHGPLYELSIEDIEINLILVDSNWNSSEITWNNKPKHEETIETVNASEIRQMLVIESYDLENTINLTEILEERQLNEISFCINITENNVEMNASVYLSGIQLIYNYEKLLISYTTIISSTIIFFILIGTIFYIRKEIYSCPKCNIKRKLTEEYCSSCEIRIEKETIIKGLYYELILIFLWLLVFFEILFLLIVILPNLYIPFLWPAELSLISGFLRILVIIAFPVLIWRKIKKYRDLRLYSR